MLLDYGIKTLFLIKLSIEFIRNLKIRFMLQFVWHQKNLKIQVNASSYYKRKTFILFKYTKKFFVKIQEIEICLHQITKFFRH